MKIRANRAIESSAIMNLRGVSTKLNQYKLYSIMTSGNKNRCRVKVRDTRQERNLILTKKGYKIKASPFGERH